MLSESFNDSMFFVICASIVGRNLMIHFSDAPKFLVSSLVPEENLNDYNWFDRDSDGPYNLAAVEEFIAKNPEMYGDYFHITSRPRLTYKILLSDRYEAYIFALKNKAPRD